MMRKVILENVNKSRQELLDLEQEEEDETRKEILRETLVRNAGLEIE
jgi:hypothetical protein